MILKSIQPLLLAVTQTAGQFHLRIQVQVQLQAKLTLSSSLIPRTVNMERIGVVMEYTMEMFHILIQRLSTLFGLESMAAPLTGTQLHSLTRQTFLRAQASSQAITPIGLKSTRLEC